MPRLRWRVLPIIVAAIKYLTGASISSAGVASSNVGLGIAGPSAPGLGFGLVEKVWHIARPHERHLLLQAPASILLVNVPRSDSFRCLHSREKPNDHRRQREADTQ
jgi:hypothetical protein